MKQNRVSSILSVEDFVKALVGEDDEDLQQLNGQSIKSTIHFVEAARSRLQALTNKQASLDKKS